MEILEDKQYNNITTGKKYYIETLGCQMNVADSELIIAMLNDKGFIESKNPWDSDAIFINTCSIRERAEEKVHSQLGRWDLIKKKKPEVVIGVLGFVPCNLEHQSLLLVFSFLLNPNDPVGSELFLLLFL